jgi:oxygen-dependent protoporphyrinogen oxidase
VYAGNPEQLSVRSAFPKLYALEEKYGGLVKGMIKGRKERKRRAEVAKDRAKMFSFREGMQSFPDAISKRLGASVTLSAEVISIAGTSGSQGARHNGQSTHRVTYTSKGRLSEIVADAVVLSIPSYSARTLVSGISPALALALDRIYYPPVAEVFLGFRSDQSPSPLNGFGYLVPAKEEREILGTIWSSSLFANRAPKGHIALTTFVGGSRQPELVDLDDSDLLHRVTGELGSIMGITGQPLFARIVRWKRAIPQYNLGHHQINEEIESFERGHRGLFICSNYRGGIAVGDCVLNGKKTADNVLAELAESRARAKAPIQE